MDSFLKKYLKGDPTLWIIFIALCFVSVVEMYSSSSTLVYKAENHVTPILKHVTFLFFGILIAYVVHLLSYRFIQVGSYFLLAFSIFLLIYVQFKGHSENDATRWVNLAGVQFQPSEFAKLAIIIVVSHLLSRIKNPTTDEKKFFYWILSIVSFVCLLIFFDNFSTAAILFTVVFVMMFIGNISLKRLIILGSIIVAFLVSGYGLVKVLPSEKMPEKFERVYTWVNRIERKFVNDENKEEKYVINDFNLQEQHGKIAIARGGLLGVLPGNSVERDFLPQAYSDFIFAIIVEETGMIGGIVVILLYMILLFRAGRIATKSPSLFPSVLVIGLSLMIVFQAAVSMLVATGIGPVTGQPLPMISRGGTSILVTSIYFGIMFGITRQLKNNGKNEDDDFELAKNDMPVVNIEEL